MQLHTLQPKTKQKSEKYIGRGGKRGTTSGKGTKGQRARSGHKIRPELRDIIKRIPKLRGRGKHGFTGMKRNTFSFSLGILEKNFSAGDTVDLKAFRTKKLIPKDVGLSVLLKILDTGKLTKKMTFKGIKFSKSARGKVLDVGGTIK